jgi:fused signal recognition particle receptor
MFSFFRKKPHAADPSPPVPRDVAAPTADQETPAERPRTALEWLNTDIGELFRKRPSDAAPPRAPEPAEAPATVEPPPDAPTRSPPPTAGPAVDAPSPSAPEPAASAPMSSAAVGDRAEEKPAEERGDWLARLRTGLRKTGSGIAQVLVGAEIDDAMYEDLEAALLQADAGVDATRHLLADLQRRITRAHLRDRSAVRGLLADCIADLLAPLERPLVIGEHQPTVIMVVGVNGAGKTTSVGKLTRHLIDANQKVLLAAADTFRAAAREQLLAWAERAEPTRAAGASPVPTGARQRVEIVSQEGGDPAGVTFDAVVAGKARGCDVVIADTAGRLATQAHLMEELKKIHRTIGKAQPGAPHEVLLVIDGNTGQNALAQVKAFDAALHLTGLVITKLDGTAKGGVLAAIALWSRSRSEPLPVYFVGVGEKLSDLQTFRAREFAQAVIG